MSRFEASLLQRHLDGCAACAAFAADVRTSTDLLRAGPLEPAPQVWLTRRTGAARRAARAAAISAATAAAALVAVSTLSLQHGGARVSGGFGLWPTGLAVHPVGDANLGVQRVAYEPKAPDGPRRGLLST